MSEPSPSPAAPASTPSTPFPSDPRPGAVSLPRLVDARLRAGAAQPFVTFYDDATGERTELSLLTWSNWVAKTANLLVEELDMEPGGTLRVDLPVHWLGTVFAAAAWSVGLAVTIDPTTPAEVVVVGPDPGSIPGADDALVVACALLPFGGPFADAPAGALDYGTSWPGHADVFVSVEPVAAQDPAWHGPDGTLTQADLLARGADQLAAGARVLTDQDPLADAAALLVGALVAGGSLVLVRHADPDSWERRAEAERAGDVRRS